MKILTTEALAQFSLVRILLRWLYKRQIVLSEHFDTFSVFRISIPFLMNLTLIKKSPKLS